MSIIKSKIQLQHAAAAIAVVLIAVIGTYLLLGVRAAGPMLSSEPENGTITAPAATVSDTAASGGRAVAFRAPVTPTPGPTPPPPPPPTSTTPLRVAAVGDIQPPSASANSDATAAEAIKADFVLGLGDYQYEEGLMSDFNAYFDKSWGPVVSKLYPALGFQHDNALINSSTISYLNGGGAHGYKTPVTLKPVTGYSFNKGGWHFVVMPDACFTNTTKCDPGPLTTWLDNDLRANTAKCTVAVSHQAYFTSTTNMHTNFTALKPWIDLLYKYHVDIYLSGWNHVYERYKPQTGGRVADANGVQAFVVGTGGVGHYTFSGSAPANVAVRNDNTYGVLNLSLGTGTYDWKFTPVRGGTFTDSGTMSCR